MHRERRELSIESEGCQHDDGGTERMGDARRPKNIYRQIFLKAEQAIAVIGSGGRYVDHNEAHRALLGYELDELRALGPALVFGESSWDEICAALIEDGTYSRTVT